jgi:hypothetical protein
VSLLPQLTVFAFTLAALIVLNRWVAQRVQIIGLRLSGSERAAMLVYYLLLWPGIVLHELSHAAMAVALGLKVGKFSLGPRLHGKYVELGSVRVARGGPVRDSLVGLAPFLSGTVVLLLVGYLVFDVTALGQAWQAGGWAGVAAALGNIARARDLWIWAYVMFAASNAMIPSPSDREPWRIVGLYLGLALVIAYVLGGLPVIADALATHVAGALQLMTLAFVFTLALDLLFAALFWLIEFLIVQFQPPRQR